MEINQKQQTGSLKIAESVIEKIAQLVIEEIDGVYSMAPSPTKPKEWLLHSQKGRSIRLKMEGGVAQIDVYVTLKNGYRIREVAEQIQSYVKDAVQNMASITVAKVNVFVCGIRAAKESAPA